MKNLLAKILPQSWLDVPCQHVLVAHGNKLYQYRLNHSVMSNKLMDIMPMHTAFSVSFALDVTNRKVLKNRMQGTCKYVGAREVSLLTSIAECLEASEVHNTIRGILRSKSESYKMGASDAQVACIDIAAETLSANGMLPSFVNKIIEAMDDDELFQKRLLDYSIAGYRERPATAQG